MTTRRAYLDYNATAPLRPEAREAMLACMAAGGNPSSVHAEGRAARAAVEAARERVAALVGASPAEVVFTSSATEAANTVLKRSWRAVCFSRIEHPCIVGPVLASDARLIDVPAGANGLLDLAELAELLEREAPAPGRSPGTSLLAVQLANNETGVVQPIGEIAALARQYGWALLCDAVQAAGRIPFDFRASGVDYLLLSSHKLGGPKGIGALVVREGAQVPPLLLGGGQERRRRAGTENVEGIAGFGAAAAAAMRDRELESARLAGLRDRLEREIASISAEAVIIGGSVPRIANTCCLAVPGTKSETLVIKLDLAGVAVSAGSACSSGKVGQSPVLAAMGIDPAIAGGAIRVSLGHATTAEDIEHFMSALTDVLGRASGASGERKDKAA